MASLPEHGAGEVERAGEDCGGNLFYAGGEQTARDFSVNRSDAMNNRIVIDVNIQHGKPVIRGTRVPVARIVGGLAGGMSVEQIQSAYEVTSEDVQAALEFAADLVEREQLHPLRQ